MCTSGAILYIVNTVHFPVVNGPCFQCPLALRSQQLVTTLLVHTLHDEYPVFAELLDAV